jgi:hypothetical protein
MDISSDCHVASSVLCYPTSHSASCMIYLTQSYRSLGSGMKSAHGVSVLIQPLCATYRMFLRDRLNSYGDQSLIEVPNQR